MLLLHIFYAQGLVFMDRDILGWRPIAKSWLEDRTHQEVHVRLSLRISQSFFDNLCSVHYYYNIMFYTEHP